MALPVNGSIRLIPALLLIYRPRKDERLSWPRVAVVRRRKRPIQSTLRRTSVDKGARGTGEQEGDKGGEPPPQFTFLATPLLRRFANRDVRANDREKRRRQPPGGRKRKKTEAAWRGSLFYLVLAAAYRRVYDSHHLRAGCQEPGSAPEPYARQPTYGLRSTFLHPSLQELTNPAKERRHGGSEYRRLHTPLLTVCRDAYRSR